MEPNYKSALVINTIFQLGLLTFAVVLGVVCNDISAAVESVQSGNYAVVESGHTVILNWNKLTIPILRQVGQKKDFTSFCQPTRLITCANYGNHVQIFMKSRQSMT